jgi:diguanylate cyclase (GGDEF)-like protein
MDEDLKKYADTLYESARMESSRTLRHARSETAQKRAWNRADLPLSGPDIQLMLKVYDDHIGRCMGARIDSYQAAYTEAGRTPSVQDFDDILKEFQAVRLLEIGHAAGAIKQSIGARALVGVPGLNFQADLENSSAHAHDRVLEKWKVWKAKTQLKPAPAKAQEREKQYDVLVPTYNKAEFALDLPNLTSTSSATQPCSLLFVDLDKFKSINDTLGHPAGDRVLKAFADALLRACYKKGTVYRTGGDEFCVTLPNHSLAEATAVAERILREVRAIRTEELPNGLSTSIGAACLPESAGDHTELLSQADDAMYVSKDARGNRVSKASTAAEPASNRQTPTQRALLAEVISELEDNLECARAPRIGDSYRRPSSQAWKNSRNKVGLPDPLRSDVTQIYREIGDWLTVVESGVHPNMGSPALNNTTASLTTRLPWLIAELKKLV